MSTTKSSRKPNPSKSIFEPETSPLLPIEDFYKRQLSFLIYASILIAVSLAIGMIGYHFTADLDWVRSYHNATMILAGMGEIDDMPNNGARIFSGSYALFSGVVFLSTVAVMFSPLIHRILHKMHLENSKEE